MTASPKITHQPASGGLTPAVSAVSASLGRGAPLLVTTSGSTGRARLVSLSAAAVRASVIATHDYLGGPGAWLLALPTSHVAGLMVVARATVAGTPVVEQDGSGGFRPEAFTAAAAATAQAAARAGVARRYVSLVPTQLHRLLTSGDATAVAALTGFDTVLLGGAPAPAALIDRARSAGVTVVRTYGMSETCGGCVYEGQPLAGVDVAIAPDDGHVIISGPMLADGYLRDASTRDIAATERVFRDGAFHTSDVGHWDGHRLRVLGRRDDMIISGGVNVAPQAVEAAIGEWLDAAVTATAQVCVVGVPDPEWGARVTAVIAGVPGTAITAAELRVLRQHVAQILEAAAAPQRVLIVEQLPWGTSGKIDRRAVAAVAAQATAAWTSTPRRPHLAPGVIAVVDPA